MLTIVKAFRNRNQSADSGKFRTSKWITRTLGKVGFFTEPMQLHEEHEGFILVEIVRESHPGLAQGTFLLEPKRILTVEDRPISLMPGMFSTTAHGGVLIVRPNDEFHGNLLILNKETRSALQEKSDSDAQFYAVVVDLSIGTVPPRWYPSQSALEDPAGR